MFQEVVIGVDIGGTKIRAGAVGTDGSLVGDPVTLPTGADEAKEKIAERIHEVIARVLHQMDILKYQVKGIGLGVTGPLDVKGGCILQCPNLPTMDYFPVRSFVEKCFELPVVLNNDANAMMLGESYWGAGKGFDNMLGITLGTGLGCALILNRQIWMGATETAGEIWTSPYLQGIIEDEVSGRGISCKYEKKTGTKLSAARIAILAMEKNPEAREVWEEFGKDVAYALGWTINLIDPEIIVVGGSISNAWELFFDAMLYHLKTYICPVPAANLKIKKASLGDNAGFMGAAALVFADSHNKP